MADDDATVEEQIAEQMGDDETTPAEPEPDTEPDTEPEPDAEPDAEPAPPPPPPTDEAMERRFKAAEKEVTRYTKRIGDVFEEHALDLAPCPLCPDIHKGFVNIHDAGRVPEPIIDTVKVFLGFAREQDYEQDEETRECPKCHGKGKTKTGSHVPNNETRKCPSCHGYGYLPPPDGVSNGTGTIPVEHAPIGERAAPVAAEDVDLSGEPRILPDGRENPNYGKWPQYKIKVAPWGDTANLTAQDALV